MEKPLVDKKYLLQKYPGKGGWTYAVIPEITPDKRGKSGWVKVKGTIDNYHIKNYRLMPMGNGNMFMPVKADIRKKIDKKDGDTIHLILYPDNDPQEIPEELQLCLEDEPAAKNIFMSFNDGQQKAYVDWILSAKTMDTKVKRITATLYRVSGGLKFEDKEDQI